VLIKGSIILYKIDRFDNEIFLDMVQENSFIYTISNLSHYKVDTFYNAQAMQDCEILQIDAEKFKALFLTKPQILQNFLNESFKTIMQLQYIINRDIIFDGMAKVAHMLCNDLDKFNKMKKQEIAYSLHLQPETLSRILKKLHKLDLIQTINNKIEIINFSDLQLIYQA
jgi:CRP/FNR family transcriptional regulator